MNIRNIILFSLLSLGIAGCKVHSEYSLYASDLRSVSKEGVVLYAPAEIKIETSSCESNKEKIINIISKYYEVVGAATCREERMDSYLVVNTKSPIIHYEQELPNRIPTGIRVQLNEDKSITVYAAVNKARWEELKDEVQDLHSSAELEIGKVTIRLNNDEREPIAFKSQVVKYNNNPYEFLVVENFERRSEAIIEFSDIFSEVLDEYSEAWVLTMWSMSDKSQ